MMMYDVCFVKYMDGGGGMGNGVFSLERSMESLVRVRVSGTL